MLLKLLTSLLLLVLSLSKCFCQPVKSKWTNKDKGTVNVNYHHIGIYPDDLDNKLNKNKLIGITVACYELTETGRQPIKSDISINGKAYSNSDTSIYVESESGKNKPGYFSIWAKEGEYEISVGGNKEFYPVKSKKYLLASGSTFQFDFYLVRKSALKKVKQ